MTPRKTPSLDLLYYLTRLLLSQLPPQPLVRVCKCPYSNANCQLGKERCGNGESLSLPEPQFSHLLHEDGSKFCAKPPSLPKAAVRAENENTWLKTHVKRRDRWKARVLRLKPGTYDLRGMRMQSKPSSSFWAPLITSSL